MLLVAGPRAGGLGLGLAGAFAGPIAFGCFFFGFLRLVLQVTVQVSERGKPSPAQRLTTA